MTLPDWTTRLGVWEPAWDEGARVPPPRSVRMPESTRSRYSLTCLGAVAVSVGGLLPGVPAVLSAFSVLIFVGLAPGCAILAWLRRPPPVSRLFVVPVLGLSVLLLLTAAAATVGWWSPRGLYAMMALACAWSVIPNLRALIRDMVP